ncbi:MerR family transcriptional regulator [Bacillus toyonensis]|uniref:MerR family transcriptional regulator n=1 Tax=Bacillus toyonensis TaxID=155322 RepID=A0AB36SXK2_9BACI|nr:MerR family transcriptional regulator [Bacillus toyonensis]PEC08931.1 MerR family transcriptional regulator [Bacillus toyonensis]PEJ61503.1 MerR family transcriptional regulator [Bacillus toyonensis]PEM87346.1 MerR family transcriptional regulator [Bacillus toyonensis]PEN47959.1 MerR family transcriptional regulator [Bacillus toyonensis]PEN72173.1 MerR family transcriptional regulator [Bacillus toyonensis]
MGNDLSFSIGKFSKETGVSIRTLHYYDEIGLLKAQKDLISGHRLYGENHIVKLQKILALKFLGYNLEEIRLMLTNTSLNLNLQDTLIQQQKAFEKKKEHLDKVLKAINQTISLLDSQKDVPSEILISLINNIQNEKNQRTWLEHFTSKEIADKVYNKTDEENLSLDKEFIDLSRDVKRLVGKPIHDPEVQELANKHLQASLKYVGEEAMHNFGKLEDEEIEDFQCMMASPYTKEEERWLDQVIEYYMVQNGMYNPNQHNDT